MATKEEKKAAREAAAAKAAADAEAAEDNEDNDTDGDEDDEDTTPQSPDTNTSPDGQTASGSAELGASTDEFDDPVTTLDALGTKSDTRVTKDTGDKDPATPTVFKQLTKALGHKSSDLLGWNERTRVAVYSNGGKYQVSKNGKSVKHLAGPTPPPDLKLNVIDARSRSPFSGTAAAINASVHDTADSSALLSRRAALERQLAEVNAQIGEG